MMTRDDTVAAIREAARRIHARTALYNGHSTDLSCHVVWEVIREKLGQVNPFEDEATELYGKLFAPNKALINNDKVRHYVPAYWMNDSDLKAADMREWRVTALLLFAAMIEAGDVGGL